MNKNSYIPVWDLPLRVFHWLFMTAIIGAIISGKAEQLWLHERFGMAVMGLVGFRLIWGFIGGRTARFAHFIKGPLQVLAVLRGILARRSEKHIGHSALGGWAVLALLLIPLWMAVTGSFSTDGILFDGPLAHLLPGQGKLFAELHEGGEPLLFLIIVLHLLALAVYWFWLRKNLIKPMVTGQTQAAAEQAAEQGAGLSASRQVFGLGLLALCLVLGQLAVAFKPGLF
jgi:cytochrome b